jgi:hypothetical protein
MLELPRAHGELLAMITDGNSIERYSTKLGEPMRRSGLLAVVIRRGGTASIPTEPEIAEAPDKWFNAELLNLGLSCGGALVSWVVAASATGAAPFTGGASLIVTNLSATAGVLGGSRA